MLQNAVSGLQNMIILQIPNVTQETPNLVGKDLWASKYYTYIYLYISIYLYILIYRLDLYPWDLFLSKFVIPKYTTAVCTGLAFVKYIQVNMFHI